jgi:transcriptional regulator with XRE-family HTH domain
LELKDLKDKRIKEGLTQSQLADEIGIDRSTLSLYENGKRKPSYEVMKQIAKVLKEPMEIQ